MQRLRPLMFVIPPFDVLEDERIQDDLIKGGVRDLLFAWGRLFDDRSTEKFDIWVTNDFAYGKFYRDFYATHKTGRMMVPPFAATPELYRGLGATPPPLAPGMEGKAERLARLTEQLAAKGLRVYYFGYTGAGVDGPAAWESDEARQAHQWDYVAARYRDFMLHYPTVRGFVTDGPGFGYEITPLFRHGGQTFAPLPTDPWHQAIANEQGIDLAAAEAASRRVEGFLHGLTPRSVDLFLESQLGVFDGIDLLMEDDAVVQLLRFKTAAVDQLIGSHHRAIKSVDPKLEYGICPRLPCFATMQGVNFRRLARITDFIQSKHYLWMEGYDGFKGTLAQYATTLKSWNPDLDEARIEALICRLLGVSLPKDYRIADFERPAPKAFFDSIVYQESKKMLFKIGDPEKISPFLGQEHKGYWLKAGEVGHLLQAMVDAGLTRFTWFILNTITDDVWNVMTEFTAD